MRKEQARVGDIPKDFDLEVLQVQSWGREEYLGFPLRHRKVHSDDAAPGAVLDDPGEQTLERFAKTVRIGANLRCPLGIESQTKFPGLGQALHFCQDLRDRRFQVDALRGTHGSTRLAEIAHRNDQLRHVICKLQRFFEQGPVIRRRAFSHQPQLNAAAQCGHGLSQAVGHRTEAFTAVLGIG